MRDSRRLFHLDPLRRKLARQEMRDELAFHVEERVAQLVARGMSPEDARAEAIRRLGPRYANTGDALERSAELKERRIDVRERLREFTDDVRYAVRGLAMRPGFTAIAVLTLGIGIGANTAIYSAVDALLLRSLPFVEPGRLLDIVQTSRDEGSAPWSYPKYAFFRNQQRSYAALAAHSASQSILTGADPERIPVEEVTAAYLQTLGIRVARGRDFPAQLDAAPAAARVALISDALWQRRFNADPAVVGRSLGLNNQPWEIIGVLPPGFRGLSGRAEVLLNLSARSAEALNEPWSLEFSLIGRLKDGVTIEQARSEASLIGPRVYDAFPMSGGSLTTSKTPEKWTVEARSLDTIRVASGLRRSLLVLFGAVGMVLLIACVNLANLLVARAVARKREIAVRLALGAGRGRLVRLLVTESLVLALMGGAASLLVALGGTRVLSAINPQETLRVQGLTGGVGAVGFEGIRLDSSALLFTFVVTVLVGLLFGLAPALGATRTGLVADLKDGGSGAGFGRRVGASRRLLVVTEVALALVLLAGSGLMIRSLGNLLNVDPGFDARDVLTLRLSVPPGEMAPDSMPGFYERLQAEIGGVPGVEHVALADCPPLNNGCNGTIMTFADRPQSSTGNAMVGVHWVSPGWFGVMRVPLRRGRGFTDSDRLNAPKVVVINEAAARQYFRGEDPIGKRVAIYQGGFHTGAEVIGIVGDVRYGTIDSTARPDVYISYGQARLSRMMVFVRTTGDASALAPTVRAAVRRIAPYAPVFDARTMLSRVATATAQTRFSAVLLGFFAIVAVSLAVMGIYGVLSFAVAQRTGEIGIRMALGAERGRVLALVMRDAATLACIGLTFGVVATLALTRVLRTMLFEVTTTDPLTYVGMVVILALAVMVASWIPARRASRVDPVVALRKG
ncbi:MAG TPA: ABC transporter permease [Gemmatimonadaceae bacterium]|nr:ABC transporter permease [Gemmatimonadaceae bacterium]